MNITVVHATHTLYTCMYIHFLVFFVLFYIYIHVHVHVGVRITEVAHDIQQQVSRCISAELHVINSYDTWHGMYVRTCTCTCTDTSGHQA